MAREGVLQWAGLAGFVGLISAALIVGERREEALREPVAQVAVAQPQGPTRVRLLALGDINLGRHVGQLILHGDTLYPFERVADTLKSYDVVFANLESNISDQNGRTQDPQNNLIFTAPPAAAQSLRRAGVSVVSTANNHALDFGLSARNQTIAYLDSARIAHCGTGADSGGLSGPARLTVKGVRLAFFAVTDIMNATALRWRRYVAAADTGALLPLIRSARQSADLVLVSFHGGNEYADVPAPRTRQFARRVLEAGADIVLGHHPHVAYGIEMREKRVAVFSLGNFVFKQPGRYWTRFSYGVAFDILHDSTGTWVQTVRPLPLHADYQPEFLSAGSDADSIRHRIRDLSSKEASEQITW
ncbi:MAG TPA: CapA family protein [Bacteroidota bacterium]|nr:CapA family protein [Bacteroidota bacterium]